MKAEPVMSELEEELAAAIPEPSGDRKVSVRTGSTVWAVLRNAHQSFTPVRLPSGDLYRVVGWEMRRQDGDERERFTLSLQ